jgi:hypothetical protein
VAHRGDLAADHHPRQARRRLGARIAARDDAPLAEDGRGLADRAHLLELVGDVEHGAALGADRGQRREQRIGLLRGEDGGGLVQDQQLRVLHQAAHDLDPLPLAHRELPDLAARLERQAIGARGRGEAFGDARQRRGLVEGERHVLGDCHRLEQGEVLEHHPDAEPARGARARQRDGRAVPQDASGIRLEQAVEDLHQRGLARAVLAEQRVDLARHHREVHGVVRHERAEALDELTGLDERHDAQNSRPGSQVARPGKAITAPSAASWSSTKGITPR